MSVRIGEFTKVDQWDQEGLDTLKSNLHAQILQAEFGLIAIQDIERERAGVEQLELDVEV